MPSDLARLFSPHSVAVIGASEALHKPGRRVLEQLRATSIRCYPVHPKNATVLGVPAFSSVADLPEVVDVAVVAVGAAAAVEIGRAHV
jgi:acyl-CoA synthetase (NDP forming)